MSWMNTWEQKFSRSWNLGLKCSQGVELHNILLYRKTFDGKGWEG